MAPPSSGMAVVEEWNILVILDLCYDHVAAHTGVKRHTCSICEMKLTYKTTLRTHVLHIHPNEDAHIL